MLPINNSIRSRSNRFPNRRHGNIRCGHIGRGIHIGGFPGACRTIGIGPGGYPLDKGITGLRHGGEGNGGFIGNDGIIDIGTAIGIIGELIGITGIININHRLTVNSDAELLKGLSSEAFVGPGLSNRLRANNTSDRFSFSKGIIGIGDILLIVVNGISSRRTGIGDGICLILRKRRNIRDADAIHSIASFIHDGGGEAVHLLHGDGERLIRLGRIILIHLRLPGRAAVSIDKVDGDSTNDDRRIHGGKNGIRSNGRGHRFIPADGIITINIRDIGNDRQFAIQYVLLGNPGKGAGLHLRGRGSHIKGDRMIGSTFNGIRIEYAIRQGRKRRNLQDHQNGQHHRNDSLLSHHFSSSHM